MNGVDAVVNESIEKLEQCDYINWGEVESLKTGIQEANTETYELFKKLFPLFDIIKKKHEDEMNEAKSIIDEKCAMYDAVLAKLQLMEEKCYFAEKSGKTTLTQDEETEEEDEDIGASFLKALSNNQIFIEGDTEEEDDEEKFFAFEPFPSSYASEDGRKGIKIVLTKCQSIQIPVKKTQYDKNTDKKLQAYANEVEILRKQNRQYLSIGIQYKEKCKKLKEKLSNVTESNTQEVIKLYELINTLKKAQ